MSKQIWRGIAFSLVLTGSAHVSAAEIQYRGFASIVGGSTLASDETLYGYEDTLNFRNDSLMALQMDATLDSNLSATMQIMSRGANSYEPVVEWAYLTYKFSDEFQVSAGRIRIPFYRYSDFMDVRYTYNWLKAPQTVYGFDFAGYDGLSGVYSTQFGRWDSSLQIIFGQFEGETSGFDATLEDLKGFSWTMTRDWLTLRAGYVSSKGTIEVEDIEQLASGVEAVGAGFGQDLSGVGSAIRLDGDAGDYYGLAVGVDYNNVLFDAEYIEYAVDDSLAAATSAYYIAAGYRFGKWIPMLTYSRAKADPQDDLLNALPASAAGLPFGDPSTGPVPTLEQLLIGAVAATETETKLMDVVLRYDFHHSAAFKLAWTQEENMNGDKNQLLRFGVDLVF
jgi:hypothetical protein